jgi:NAD(P)-dependent dehydrogenase (short-subunit alcohol dehydrogenase family)
MPRAAVVAGVGPGLGASIARKLASEGCQVALLARSEGYLDDLAEELGDRGLAVPTDLADPAQITDAFETVRETFGPVDVLVNHASGSTWKGLRDLPVDEFQHAWEVAARGGFCCSKEVVSDMVDGDGGTIIFTGATSSIRGREGSLGFSSAKFAVRGMAESMARELGPEGVHVAHVVLDGGILPPDREVDDPESYLDPDTIAESYWHLVEQDRVDTMSFEVHLTNGNGTIEFL